MIYKISDFINDITRAYNRENPDTKPGSPAVPMNLAALNLKLKQTQEVEEVFSITKPPKLHKYRPTLWPETDYMLSSYQKKYQKKKSTKLKMKMELAEQLTILNIHPATLARALTYFDIEHLKAIHSSEFIDYGSEPCPGISAWLKHNTIVHHFVLRHMNAAYFLKVAMELEAMHNYNTMNTVVSALKNVKLSGKMFAQIAELIKYDNYFTMREKIDKLEKVFTIIPIEFFLKDIEESNKNLDSEIASKRFVKQIEFFVNMQEVDWVPEKKLKKKLEHFLVVSFYASRDFEVEKKVEDDVIEVRNGAFFLFI